MGEKKQKINETSKQQSENIFSKILQVIATYTE